MDAEKIRRVIETRGDIPDMWEVLQTHGRHRTWRAVHQDRVAKGDTAGAARAAEWMADEPEISDLDALCVTTLLAERLLGCRWFVMRDAREAGASWQDIAVAIGLADRHDAAGRLTVAASEARDWYVHKIEEQENHVPDHHDVARARAVVGDPPPESPDLSTC